MNQADLFAIPVVGFTLDSVAKNLSNIIEHLKSIEYTYTGETGSFSNDQQILKHEIFNPVVEEIHRCIDRYIGILQHDVGGTTIVSSWSNIVKENQYIQPHTHSNSYICGVIHLSSGSELAFRRPNIKDWFQIDADYADRTGALTKIPSIESQLVLFPSNLTHSVLDSNFKEDRLSIAFNTWPKRYGRPTGWVEL